MKSKQLKPDPKYLVKLFLILTILAVLILIVGFFLAWLMSRDADIGTQGGQTVMIIIFVLDMIWWLPAMFLTRPYYRSLSYEIQEDEVIVHVGIFTQSVKHVPYRTVTNITVQRGLLDRLLFSLGTLNIQTAGMSGTQGAEESLVGLADVQAVYDIVVTELRRFRGAMLPTTTEIDTETAVVPTPDLLPAILNEIQVIRHVLETKESL